MTNFTNRTPAEQAIITKAYEFEREAILTDSTERNPYLTAIEAMGLLEALNEALEMAFN